MTIKERITKLELRRSPRRVTPEEATASAPDGLIDELVATVTGSGEPRDIREVFVAYGLRSPDAD